MRQFLRQQTYIFSAFLLTIFTINTSIVSGETPMVSALEKTIVDANTREPLPYTTIYNCSRKQGTISNLNGYFSLKYKNPKDTIQLSTIGYATENLPIALLLREDTIFLHQIKQQINELTVFANSNYFYKLMNKCREKALKEMNYAYKTYKTAKCYFELKTEVDSQQVELIESYYNGNISKYNINSLDFKNGRLALNTVNNRYYLSTSTSSTFYKHNLFKPSSIFPGNPLELNIRELHKTYQLSLVKSYVEADKSTWYMINFTPKNDYLQTYFKGTIWIDSTSLNIGKIALTIKDAQKHPFIAIVSNQALDKCDMSITKKFEEHDGSMYIKSIDFKYDNIFRQEMAWGDDSLYHTSTSAIIYAYDYKQQFIRPFFRFADCPFKDYTQISSATYNQYFWDNISEFTLNDTKNKSDLFIKENSEIDQFIDLFSPELDNGNRFNKGYQVWSRDRIHLPAESVDTLLTATSQSDINTLHYKLTPKIYFDITYLNDSIHIYSKSMLDLNESFYKFPATPMSMVFLNIYFDLIEINRRAFMEKNIHISPQEMANEYRKNEQAIDQITHKYITQTGAGSNLNYLLIWNDMVLNKLGIDNASIFKLKRQ